MRKKIQKIAYILPILVLFLIVAIYAGSRTYNVFIGPRIHIASPENGEALSRDIIVVEGVIENATNVFLNDRQIFTDEKGSFREKLLLHYGYNIIEIRAKDRFKQETQKTLELVYR